MGLFTRNKSQLNKEQYSLEQYTIPRQYGNNLSTITLTRKCDEYGRPLSQMIDDKTALPIYILEGAPEVKSMDGNPLEVYAMIDQQRMQQDPTYVKAMERLFSPDRVQKIFEQYGGYAGRINEEYNKEINSNYVRNIYANGLQKSAILTDYCRQASEQYNTREESRNGVYGKIYNEYGNAFGSGNNPSYGIEKDNDGLVNKPSYEIEDR